MVGGRRLVVNIGGRLASKYGMWNWWEVDFKKW